jgi:NADPH:quinone reductase
MRALYYEKFGGPDVLQLGELPQPHPGPGQVLVRVRASGVNPVDWKIREGWLQGLMEARFPVIPGLDVAGEVVAEGTGVSGWLGKRVMAFSGTAPIQWGTAAEFSVADAAALAPIPAGLDNAQAAILPLASLTAWQALFDIAELKAGQSIFIPGASGGVGSYAVGLAKAHGATVVATAGPSNLDYIKRLGADHVIDYRATEPWAAAKALMPGGYDAAFNTVQGADPAVAVSVLKPGGCLVDLNTPVPAEVLSAAGVRGQMVYVMPNGDKLARIAALAAAGQLKLPELKVLPLDQGVEAHRLSQAGHVRGKLALAV